MLGFMVYVELDQLLKFMNDTHRWATCDQIVDAVTSRTTCEPPSTFLRNMLDLKFQTQKQLNYLVKMGLLSADQTDAENISYIISNTWHNAVSFNDYVPDTSTKIKKPTSDDEK